MISLITPVFYKNKHSFIYKRALELIKKFSNHSKFELIIADASKKSFLSSSAKNVKIIHTYSEDKIFSPAKARNQGSLWATQKYLFFFDVDLDYDLEFEINLFEAIYQQLETNQTPFILISFLYLTPQGTKLFESTKCLASLKESFLRGENQWVESISPNSNAMVISKAYFEKLGRFSEDFLGHGGEDYEFLHRLVALNPKFCKNPDYYTDYKNPFVANYKGFRAYMAYYSLPHFFKNLILLHRWHSRPLSNKFYLRRIPNETLLQKKMKAFDETYQDYVWKCTKNPPQIEDFITQLMQQYGYSKETFPGFFSYAKGIKPLKRPLGAKIRKFITRPKDFIKDMKIYKTFARK